MRITAAAAMRKLMLMVLVYTKGFEGEEGKFGSSNTSIIMSPRTSWETSGYTSISAFSNLNAVFGLELVT